MQHSEGVNSSSSRLADIDSFNAILSLTDESTLSIPSALRMASRRCIVCDSTGTMHKLVGITGVVAVRKWIVHRHQANIRWRFQVVADGVPIGCPHNGGALRSY